VVFVRTGLISDIVAKMLQDIVSFESMLNVAIPIVGIGQIMTWRLLKRILLFCI
jgi:hypothetical protein